MIGIIDYGAGNLMSVKKALDFLSLPNIIVDSPEVMKKIDRLILPGVGAFQAAVDKLKEKGLFGPLKEWITSGRDFLGICLGMQILFRESEESPGAEGFSIFNGAVKRFMEKKVPQIGWNLVEARYDKEGSKSRLLDNPGSNFFYFLHGYYVVPEREEIVAGKTVYGNTEYASMIESGNICAVQFHPEKSGRNGLDLIANWVRKC